MWVFFAALLFLFLAFVMDSVGLFLLFIFAALAALIHG